VTQEEKELMSPKIKTRRLGTRGTRSEKRRKKKGGDRGGKKIPYWGETLVKRAFEFKYKPGALKGENGTRGAKRRTEATWERAYKSVSRPHFLLG